MSRLMLRLSLILTRRVPCLMPFRRYPHSRAETSGPQVFVHWQGNMSWCSPSESVAGRGNCIGWAVSTTGQGFTPNNGLSASVANPSIGYLDPYIFVNPNGGTVWLIYSQPGRRSWRSRWIADRHSSDELERLGVRSWEPGRHTRHLFAGVFIQWQRGIHTEIENPSMTSDDYNGYDLTYSLGTWTLNATYVTGESPCLYEYEDCLPGDGAAIMPEDGGASALVDSTPSNNWLIFHTWSGSNRVDMAGPTGEVDENPSGLAVTTSMTPQSAAAAGAQPLQVTQTPTQVVPFTWKPRVINPNHPNLVIGYTGPPETIAANAPPVAGPQTLTASPS